MVMQFGAWSTFLGVVAVQNMLLATLLFSSRINNLANRLLGLLLICIVGMMTPFVIGYAGAYDRWPWLTYAPFAVPLAIGPLLYGHIVALSRDRILGWHHFAAPLFQFAYQACLFPWPLATKWQWDEQIHQPYVEPLFALAVIASMGIYAALSWRELAVYQAWLSARRRKMHPARRLRFAAIGLSLLLIARSAFDLFDWLVRSITYFDLFSFYILLGTTGLILGALGWRESRTALAAMDEVAERDWHEQGRRWLDQTRRQGWWRNPDLDLERLARQLGTNTTHLSRALNEGHGGFATAIGALRAEAVAQALDQGDEQDLLDLALACGFGSKASFNRIFRARFGLSPSAYRGKQQGSNATSLHKHG